MGGHEPPHPPTGSRRRGCASLSASAGVARPMGAIEGEGSRQVGGDQPERWRNDGHVLTCTEFDDVLWECDVSPSHFTDSSLLRRHGAACPSDRCASSHRVDPAPPIADLRRHSDRHPRTPRVSEIPSLAWQATRHTTTPSWTSAGASPIIQHIVNGQLRPPARPRTSVPGTPCERRNSQRRINELGSTSPVCTYGSSQLT